MTCPFCGEQIQPSAAVCRFCNRTVPKGCVKVHSLGQRTILGETASGYGLWSVSAPEPFAVYQRDGYGWDQAVLVYNRQEFPPRQPVVYERDSTMRWLRIGSIFFLLCILYYAYHSYKYNACLIEPGIFQWPSSCL